MGIRKSRNGRRLKRSNRSRQSKTLQRRHSKRRRLLQQISPPLPQKLRTSHVRFLHPRRSGPVHLGQLQIARPRHLNVRRVPRRLSSGQHAAKTPRRNQAHLRPIRPIRHAQLHERHVRRQFLFQQSSRLCPQSKRPVDARPSLHLRHPPSHRPRPLGK